VSRFISFQNRERGREKRGRGKEEGLKLIGRDSGEEKEKGKERLCKAGLDAVTSGVQSKKKKKGKKKV